MIPQENTQMALLFVVVATVTFTFNSASPTKAVEIVAPAGFEDLEGNLSNNPGDSYPGGANSTPDGFRIQELFLASDFSPLGPGPFVITAAAYRPDISVIGAVSSEFDISALNLSTTTKNSLDSRFEDNYGVGGSTTVLSGVVQLDTDGVARPGGLPHDFDYVFDFQTPYVYDPQEGNLLVEFSIANDLGVNQTWFDATGDVSGRTVFAFADDAVFASNTPNRIGIMQFTIVPEPSSLLLSLLGPAAVLLSRSVRTRR
jgi:hypothetical protein